MSDLFRSKEMKYVQLTIPSDAAHLTLQALGEFGGLHVIDLSDREMPSKQYLTYKKRAQDCLYWLKKIASFKELMDKYDVSCEEPLEEDMKLVESADILHEVEEFFNPLEKQLVQNVNVKRQNLQEIHARFQEEHTLSVCMDVNLPDESHPEHPGYSSYQSSNAEATAVYAGRRSSLNKPLIEMHSRFSSHEEEKEEPVNSLIAGVIDLDKQNLFSRMLYRVSRGNAYVRFVPIEEPIEDPVTDEFVFKTVFYTLCIGETLTKQVHRLCDMFGADVYEMPTAPQYRDRLEILQQDQHDKKEMDRKTNHHIVSLLHAVAEGKSNNVAVRRSLYDWVVAIKREQATCEGFMKCHFYLTMLCVEGWVTRESIPDLEHALQVAVEGRGMSAAQMEVEPMNRVSTEEHHSHGAFNPPTYFPTTKVTGIYQMIVNTYGVPRYQEVNPALFTIATFPFLFGVMYGDIGHGFALFLMSLYFLYNEKKFLLMMKKGEMDEIMAMAFEGRWVLLPMSIMAVYCGFIYNDCMSNPLYLFSQQYKWEGAELTDGYLKDNYRVYPFGVDPSWYHTTNELSFFNSLKMKTSVIIGVIHMSFGVCLSFFNHLHNKDTLSIMTDFFPRIIFMTCTFGYMDLMIVLKWCTDWSIVDWEDTNLKEIQKNPPNLISTMIDMFLSPLVVKQHELYAGQAGVQLTLVIIAFLCVPILLFAKPLILSHRATQAKAALDRQGNMDHGVGHDLLHEHDSSSDNYHDVVVGDVGEVHDNDMESATASDSSSSSSSSSGGHGHGDGEEFDLSGELIHQSIHTIEFILGCVSNTASYLRLWALSLAHGELAQVFWNMLFLQYGLQSENPVLTVFGVLSWAAATTVVLLCMDVLECFLHALRLHWVEFQNKFFYADGYLFTPFHFDKSTSLKIYE